MLHWREQRLKDIQKKARQERRIIYYQDESTFQLLPSLQRTYALKGHTPVITRGDSYKHLTVASAISEEGDLFYQLRTTAFKGKALVLFLEKLLKSTRKKILLIWDGAPAHVSKEVKAFLASPKAKNRLWIEKLPPYSPELNPDEQVWHHLKNVELKNICNKTVSELKICVKEKIEILKNQKEKIRQFFQHKDVGFYA